MTPALRKLTITAHVTFSVGWLGAVAAFLALSIAGLTTQDAEVVRGVYLSMNLISRFVIIPVCFAALATGLLQALGTPWGLFRYYWILLKFGLAIFVRGSGGGGKARIRGCGRNIVQPRLRSSEDRTRPRSQPRHTVAARGRVTGCV